MKRWRSKSDKRLFAQPILKHEWPRLVDAMMEDGLHAQITEKGIVFTVKQYVISLPSVRSVWGLSESQSFKLRDYILTNDPWGSVNWE